MFNISEVILKNKMTERICGYTNNKNSKASVKEFLHSLMITTSNVPLETVLMLPAFERTPSEDEIRALGLQAGSTILQSYRLAKNKIKYQSRGYRSSSNNCSYCVKFLNNSIKYGFVDFYVQHEKNIYARVSLLEMPNKDLLSNFKGNTRNEFKHLDFNLIYKVLKETNTKVFIYINDIIKKCFIAPTFDDFFVLSDFITEDEHD